MIPSLKSCPICHLLTPLRRNIPPNHLLPLKIPMKIRNRIKG